MVRHETPWGVWDPMTPVEVRELLAGLDARWWIAGGYAIEAFVGRKLREHEDVDVGVLRQDQLAVQRALGGWELHAADPPGTLRPWLPGEKLPPAVHDIWARQDQGGPWRFQLMINESDGGTWVYRRDPRIRRPLKELCWTGFGARYLAPEIQLLFKSKSPRPKDQVDFEAAVPVLVGKRRVWLRQALEIVDPGNAWIERLSEADASP